MTPSNGSPLTSPVHHPDLSDEVASLSTKLINAINHQTFLDDTLSATRHELEAARERIRELEATNASQRETLSGEVWVQKSSVEAEKKVLRARAAEEKMKRMDTEIEKKKIEQELENLTAALFEEANKMVVKAKEEAKADHDNLQRKNDQIKAQLADSESLLKSQQEQLTELKHVMEGMASERDDQTTGTAPSSPGIVKFDPKDVERITSEGAPSPSIPDGMAPTHPTNFHHLIQPVLRHDLAAYDDFVSLARLSKHHKGPRVSSGSAGGLAGLSLVGLSGYSTGASNSSIALPNNGSPSATNSAPQSPTAAGFSGSPGSAGGSGTPMPSLRETKFYRRALAEDIEPTLRLDAAPSLSWLARRSVLSAVCDGTLVVEPVPTTGPYVALTKPQFYPCSLCGESRKDPAHLRNHRFRASETDSAQRYPLCRYCLGRVRSTCDFLGFLRIVKDGHWRADDENQEKSAWEESVRLREQMFWSRIGGGVVPAGQVANPIDIPPSPRRSHDSARAVENTSTKPQADDTQTIRPEDKELPAEPTDDDVGQNDGFTTPPEQTDGATHQPEKTDHNDTTADATETSGERTNRLSVTIPSITYQ
ncbi:GDP/GTP exchange factor sec2p domain-containing protein [Sarocladium implicatum]|nr:GDP/GTP exchange factor sec2p domain-containing protein [Sarocladium implicatum]